MNAVYDLKLICNKEKNEGGGGTHLKSQAAGYYSVLYARITRLCLCIYKIGEKHAFFSPNINKNLIRWKFKIIVCN